MLTKNRSNLRINICKKQEKIHKIARKTYKFTRIAMHNCGKYDIIYVNDKLRRCS